ncbi:MAG: ATP-binding protein [Bacteroidota bacterium]
MATNDRNELSENTSPRPGYRLQALEVYNWGTFHHKLWHILPHSENALLTGDIGSGKSTLVDAITTLLVPHHKIVFNAAAGAQSKERTIRSYILGEYKNVREGFGVNSKPVSLRNPSSTYSVLIARFSNETLGEQISLAQVLWVEDGKDRKFFIVAKGALSFQGDFTDFGSDVMQLKNRLRKVSHMQVFDSFKEYNQRFRQYFGMATDKTLQLFYQTVSMKSVDNLTLFVRNHMLEEPDAREQLNHLLQNFDNLQKAHQSVMKARSQMEMLEPVVTEGSNYEKLSNKVQVFEYAQMALPGYVAEKKTAALQQALDQAENELMEAGHHLEEVETDIHYLKEQIEEVQHAYLEKGGNRINLLKNNIENLGQEKQKKQIQWERYVEQTSTLNLPLPEDLTGFSQNQKRAAQLSEEFERGMNALDQVALDLKIASTNQDKELKEEEKELQSLLQRKNQIPEHLISLRAEMTDSLGIQEEQVPFVGELLRVKDEENQWEGAIERVLHGFSLSLLVADKHYHEVSEYINQTNLRGRLVYFRTVTTQRKNYDFIPDNSLLHKVELKPETPFEDWLEIQLEERYNYLCVDSLEEFRRTPYALTRQGQIKQGRSRH